MSAKLVATAVLVLLSLAACTVNTAQPPATVAVAPAPVMMAPQQQPSTVVVAPRAY